MTKSGNGDQTVVNLDPTLGSKIQKSRPCLIISPDEMNDHNSTVIIALMTTKSRSYPTRVQSRFEGKDGYVVLDQIRTVDKIRLLRKLGKIPANTQKEVISALFEMFSE